MQHPFRLSFKSPSRSHDQINNAVYDEGTDNWWDEDTPMYLLKSSANPLRVNYFRRILFETLRIDPNGRRALEIGSGGGILTEEIAGMGFRTDGIEPSAHSVHIAAEHARQSQREIHYVIGCGEQLPYPDACFDVVFCCDVLEHVRDLPSVIAEIGRVLKPGGVFCFDTINRTLISHLVVIKLAQEFKPFSFMPPRLHVWDMFIKPAELKALLAGNGIEWKGLRGATFKCSVITLLKNLRRRKKGLLTYRQLGETLQLQENSSTAVFYMGYAVKKF